MNLTNLGWITNSGIFMYILLGAIWGDTSAIIIGFLQAQGTLKGFFPITFTFIGMILADLVFFFLGRSQFFKKIEQTNFGKKIFRKIDSTIDFLTIKSLALALFYCKFITGVKFIINVYLGRKNTLFKKYFFLNLFMGLFWTSVAWTIGYLAGEGFREILEYFENLTIALLVLAFLIGLIFNFSKKIKNHFNKKYKQNVVKKVIR